MYVDSVIILRHHAHFAFPGLLALAAVVIVVLLVVLVVRLSRR
jgi:hypothetical protein